MRRVAVILFLAFGFIALGNSPAFAVGNLTFTPTPAVAGGTITFTSTCQTATSGSVFLGTLAGPLANQSYSFTGSSNVKVFNIPANATPGRYPTSLTCPGEGFADRMFEIVAAPPPNAVPSIDYRLAGAVVLLAVAPAVVLYRRRRGRAQLASASTGSV